MKQITKMRIIHTLENSPEAEYLKTFFEYIGIMVHDEIVQDEYAIHQHLNLANDDNGVDIVLNFRPEYLSEVRNIPNRFYMYFSSKEKYCVVSDNIKYYGEQMGLETINSSKKETRIQALEFLIDTIWEYDEKNRTQIQKIKDYYVSKDEDRDLFYVLQAKKCLEDVFFFAPSSDINAESKQLYKVTENITLYEYVKRMFLELWRMHCLLENSDNQYAIYAKINTELLLRALYSYIYESEQPELVDIQFDKQRLQILPLEEIIDSIRDFIKNNFWFESAYIMLSQFDTDFRKSIYQHLINNCKKSRFPAYYSSIYYDIGRTFLPFKENNKATQWFKKAVELNPLNIKASWYLGALLWKAGKHSESECYLKRMGDFLGLNSRENDLSTNLSFSVLAEYYFCQLLYFRVALSSGKEFSMKGRNESAFNLAFSIEYAAFIRMIADDDEGACREFIEYNEMSEYMWVLYELVRQYNPIVNDEHIRVAIDEKLSRWVDDLGEFVSGTPKDANDKQYQKEFKPQEQ